MNKAPPPTLYPILFIHLRMATSDTVLAVVHMTHTAMLIRMGKAVLLSLYICRFACRHEAWVSDTNMALNKLYACCPSSNWINKCANAQLEPFSTSRDYTFVWLLYCEEFYLSGRCDCLSSIGWRSHVGFALNGWGMFWDWQGGWGAGVRCGRSWRRNRTAKLVLRLKKKNYLYNIETLFRMICVCLYRF